jgi:hypothetical protein
VETIAVYWEPRIKTYGFNEVTDLSLLEFLFRPGRIGEMDLELQELEVPGEGFFLVFAQIREHEKLSLYVLVKYEWEAYIRTQFLQTLGGDPEESVRVTSPVGLIYFHGPHFGDRYGIAHAACGALAKESIPVLAAGCSVSSVYLVLSEEGVAKGRKLLSEAFELPQS